MREDSGGTVREVEELHEGAFETAKGLADIEGEAEGLDDFVLGREDLGWVGANAASVFGEGHVSALSLGGEEEYGFVEFLGRIGKDRVAEVEALEVLHCGGFDIDGPFEMVTCCTDLLAVALDEVKFFF